MIVKFTGVEQDVYINTTYITSVVAISKPDLVQNLGTNVIETKDFWYVVIDFVGGGSKSILVNDHEEAIKKTKSLTGLMDPAQLSNSASAFREV